MGEFIKVADASKVPPGSRMVVDVEGEEVLLMNVDGRYYAVSELCTHRGGMLSGGDLTGTTLACPIHNSEFDIATGEAILGPASEPLTVYQVRQVGMDIEVAAPD